ncbi:hypothetical protein [Longimicrobium sp.]|jgi:hypothetical protein|uniref:hypothetical protein n=1 Tax=Longimicrobium sp. TaxID=2029185 RepID=UPI002F939CA6
MSGTGRNAGGSSAMGDKGGSGDVHSGLHSAGGGDQYEGLQFAGSEEGGSRSRLGGAAEAIRDRVGEGARNLAGEVGPRVARVASTTRDRANRAMEQRGLVDRLRDNPLPILGVAFAIGFVLAARDDDDDDYGTSKASRARRELRSALMGGISAGIAQGARGFLSQTNSQGSGFLAELIDGFMGGQQGGGSQGGSAGGSTGRAAGSGGGSGAGSGGGRTGGSAAGASGGGSAGGYGGSTAGASRAGTSGSGAGSTGGSRPPSHQEDL